jgi:hypothetical protein
MMVCRYDESRLLLVLQVDHSRVAGLFAAHWGNDEFAPLNPYAAMVLAAQEHDSGWWDWEIKPTLNEQGRPPDYIGAHSAGRAPWLRFYRHGIERVAEQDPYAGLIVLMHAEGLLTQGKGLLPYMRDATDDPLVQDFLRQSEALRQALLDELRQNDRYRAVATDEHLWTSFKYMEVFDQMAQFICNRYPLNSTERRNGPTNTLSDVPVPVAPGREDTTITVDILDETRARVHPWPFDVDALEVSFPARLVPDRAYEGQDEFLDYFYRAERLAVTYMLHPDNDPETR